MKINQPTQKPLMSLEEKLQDVVINAKIGDKVKVLQAGVEKKKGVIVKLGTLGAWVYDQSENGGDANAESAEFFFFKNRVSDQLGGIVFN